MNQEELKQIISDGYAAALEKCFDTQSMYAKGFIDGIMFIKKGIKPKSEFQKILDNLESENNGTVRND